MVDFNSRRERRLWTAALLVVAGIFSTLGLAGSLANELGQRGMIEDAFFVTFLITMAVIVVVGVRQRASVEETALVFGVLAVYVFVGLRVVTAAAERTHLIEYSVLALLIHAALLERQRPDVRGRPALIAFGVASSVGVTDELIQLVLPTRVFDPIDIGFNVFAAGLAMASVTALRWLRALATARNRGA